MMIIWLLNGLSKQPALPTLPHTKTYHSLVMAQIAQVVLVLVLLVVDMMPLLILFVPLEHAANQDGTGASSQRLQHVSHGMIRQ